MKHTLHARRIGRIALAAALLAGAGLQARADAVTDWNVKAGQIVVEAKLGTPPANRVLAVVHAAVYEAANAVTRRYPATRLSLDAAPGASVEAAIAAANQATLARLLPAQQAAIDAAYQAALDKIADGPAKAAGIALGQQAAAGILALRADDNAAVPEAYRPHAGAGSYVPTALPGGITWSQRKPWLMESAAQFRPGPPPALTSAAWARDYNEIKALGGKTSARRSAEQVEVARFWEYSLPPIYHGVLRSLAEQPGREVTRNARLFAAATQAGDDALTALFEAKYHYNFWRPVTAIRNGDIDGNEATERDPAWTALIDNPLHPEYPSAHATLAGALGAVLQADIGRGRMPVLATASPSANGAVRRWTKVEDFMQEVADARVWEGVHFRFSTEAGTTMGRQIGELAAARLMQAPVATLATQGDSHER